MKERTSARRLGARFFACASVLTIAACSGGGGGGSSLGSFDPGNISTVADFSLPTVSSATSFETAEYNRSTGLSRINASSAYAVDGSGDGVTVAVIDSGIDTRQADLQGAIHADSININNREKGDIGDTLGHGTTVAGVIGARRNGSGTHGVAYNSRILAIRAEAGGDCSPTCAFDQSTLAKATDYAVDKGARVINYSLGGADNLSDKLHNAMANAVDRDRLLVLAAGNDGDRNPTQPGGFAARGDADGAAIVVGAVDGNNKIASFSNRAGSAADHFLVAPGVNIRTTKAGGGTTLASGTSIATPFVSGAAAVILDAAPFLSAGEVASLLLSTATDLGEKGTDKVYGHGLLNLAEALSPQGEAVIPTGTTVEDGGRSFAATSLSLGPAFGDALQSSLGAAIFLDGYGRAYEFDMDERLANGGTAFDMRSWLRPDRFDAHSIQTGDASSLSLASIDHGSNSWSTLPRDAGSDRQVVMRLGADIGSGRSLRFDYGAFSPLEVADAPATGLMSDRLASGLWSRDAWMGAGLAQSFGESGSWTFDANFATSDHQARAVEDEMTEAHMIAASLTRHLEGEGALGLQLGQAIEEGGLLDSQGSGAFDVGGDGHSTFINLFAALPLAEGYSMHARAILTHTRMDSAAGGMIRSIDPVTSSGFSLGLTRRDLFDERDSVTFAITQPQRVETGKASMALPTGRSVDGAVSYRDERASLAPSGREIDVELGYALAVSERLDFGGNLMLRLEPGHDRDAEPEGIAAVRMNYRFD